MYCVVKQRLKVAFLPELKHCTLVCVAFQKNENFGELRLFPCFRLIYRIFYHVLRGLGFPQKSL